MNLTALIAELYVGGVLSVIWLLMLIGVFVDVTPLLEFAKDYPLGGTVLFSVAAYALGVVFDRVWDDALKTIDVNAEKKHFSADVIFRLKRRHVFGNKTESAEFVSYIRSRSRIARALLCNGLLLGLSGLLLYIRRSSHPEMMTIAAIAITTAVICYISFFSLVRLSDKHYAALQLFAPPTKPPEKSHDR